MNDPVASSGFSRRRLLAGAGTVGTAAVAAQAMGAARTIALPASRLPEVLTRLRPMAPIPKLSFTTQLRRRLDVLYLDVDFYNLTLNTDDPTHPTLVKRHRNQDALVVVRFPAQHLLEQAFTETDGGGSPPGEPLIKPPVQSRVAGESRLAFAIPDAQFPLAFDLDSLLEWQRWRPQVVPVAFEVDPRIILLTPPALRAPRATETAIEMPWWLILSPRDTESWRHRGRLATPTAPQPTLPITLNGRTDLWQTNLQAKPSNTVGVPTPLPSVQAVWDYDPRFSPQNDAPASGSPANTAYRQPYPFNQALTRQDWHDIIWNTSKAVRPTIFRAGYTPVPVEVERFGLTALGGYVDGQGHWKPPATIDLIEWDQQTFLGRDAFVKTVRKGYLFPFGIPAVKVTITERKFNPPQKNPAGAPPHQFIAYLRKRTFLVVNPNDKDYVHGFGQTASGPRQLPFNSLRSTTLVTPNLQPQTDFVPGVDAFVPMVLPNQPFRFHLVGTDWAGNEIDLTSPAVFVASSVAVGATPADVTAVGKIRNAYGNLAVDDDLRLGNLHGKMVAMAASAVNGDTSHEVKTITWGSHPLDQTYSADTLNEHKQPLWYPTMHQASVRLTPVEQVSGASIGGVDLKFHGQYTDQGLGASHGNKGDVYLVPAVAPVPLGYQGQSCGAVALPNISIVALSRLIGPVGGDIAAAQAGTFDAQKFFQDADAKILGAVDLYQIVEDGDLEIAPTISSSEQGNTITTLLHFEPVPKTDGSAPGGANYFVPDGDDTTFVIDATVVQHKDNPGQSITTVDGAITNFTMWLLGDGSLGFVSLHFSQLRFHSETGQTGTVDPHVDATGFHGPMEFIQTLQEYLNFGGSGPAIDVEPTQITASVGFSIPNIDLGVFTFENLSFSAGLILPFTGEPAQVSFGFCSRENPFHLTISLFGGGGWFGITLDLHGVHSFEIGLEFGASAAIDLGVASGEVHIWAGIYFQLETNDDGDEHCTITGYVRAGGSVEVLCIASVSLEAYLGFTYDNDGGTTKVGGEASLTLTVSVLCFSASVSADFQQYFGGEGDPSFADLVPPDQPALPPEQWTSDVFADYCAAFAGDTVVVSG